MASRGIMFRFLFLAGSLCMVPGSRGICEEAPAAKKAVPKGPEVTQNDIVPVILQRCAVCHGLRRKESGLDLRTRASMLRGGKSGPAITLGKPAESLALKRIRAGEMPPPRKVVEVSVKPIAPAEIDLLSRWIELGAPEVEIEPDGQDGAPDPLVTDEDRKFWAFRPPRPQDPPPVRRPELVRNPIDGFLLAKLEERGLSFSAEADRATLLRRLCLDLTGLLPEPAEVEGFLADRDPEAYSRLVDRLLASPRYGERWARHWLDVAGYADSEGKREQDLPRPSAYRYRDYVIRSLNEDKPYDRFLLEQIAGDELADSENAPEITDAMYQNLVATGFLRMAPDPTWASITNFVSDRLEVIADEIEVLGSGVLGLTVKCARCHNHKFDPIPQRDYYRLADILKPAYDENDWLRSGWHPGISTGERAERELPRVATTERRAWEAENRAIDEEVNRLKATLAPGAASAAKAEVEKRIQEAEARRRPEPRIRALWDRGEPSPTYILRRGDPLSPGKQVGPGVPSVLTDGRTAFRPEPPWPGARKTGRRLALARWLVRPDHPLTARVAVNRLWKNHFGAGIVKTLGDFGKAGARPTHPELLDWLALELVGRGWSLKAMHRLMVTSAAYRQEALVTPERAERDPENALLSRMPLLRMEAEVLYDSLLQAAGRLDESRFGPPDPVEARPDGLVMPVGSEKGWRRMVYVRQERKQLPTILENFDLPQMNPNCLERRESTVSLQALYLMNNGMVEKLARDFAARVRKEAGDDPGAAIERVYLIALGRRPSGEELELGKSFLSRWPGREPAAPSAALSAYCHTILNSAGFLYID
jgi:hypothetical protein